MEDFTFKSMKLVRSYDIYREKNAEDAYVKPVPQAGLEPLALPKPWVPSVVWPREIHATSVNVVDFPIFIKEGGRSLRKESNTAKLGTPAILLFQKEP